MKTHAPDYRYLASIALLIAFGFIMLSSASAVIGFQSFGDSYFFIKRQLLLGLVPGIILGWVALKYDYRNLERFAPWLFIGSLVLLLLVFVPGIGQSYGTFAKRWIHLGPINFQPSEIIKLTLVIYLAAWLSKRGTQLRDFKSGFVPYFLTVGLVMGLIILEPDLGTASIIGLMALALFFLAGGRLTHILFLFAAGIILAAALVYVEPYRLNRLSIFLHPQSDPQGIGYHINQSFLAIGSGGLFGRGYGNSRAKFQYLPEVTGDSIFAIIGEELGFLMAAAFLILLVYIFFRNLKISQLASDNFGRLLVAGIAVWFIGQATVNISAMIGLLPLTGIPLPFVSYGGTALAVALTAVGVVGSVSARGHVEG